MRLGKRYLPLVVLSGVAAAALPTLASSTPSASITAVDSGLYEHAWQAGGVSPAEVAVTPGSEVSFSYPSGNTYHYPVFETGPAAPSCTGLPTTTLAGRPGWSGSCAFSQAGVYEFWCGVHGALMKAFVYVNAAGTVPTTTTTTTTTTPSTSTSTTVTTPSTTTTTTTTTTATSTTATSTPPPLTSTTEAQTPSASTPPGASGSSAPGSGPRTPTLALAKRGHGTSVRGSIELAPIYGGSRLEIDLLTKGASLASAKHSAQVRVGSFVRAAVSAGRVSFAIPLNAKAKRALRRRGRLALTVRLTLTPPGGKPVTTTRGVVVRR